MRVNKKIHRSMQANDEGYWLVWAQCAINGQTYPSITECAKAVGASMSSVFGAIKYGHRCKGHHYIRMA